MKQSIKYLARLKSQNIFMVSLVFLITGCVSINTGQASGTKPQQTQAPDTVISSKDSKVSLEEAASFNMTLGAQYLKQNKLEQAIKKLEKAVEQQPTLGLAHTYLGFAYEQYGETTKAKEHYAKSIKLNPDDPVSLNNYGTFLCRNNEWRDSLVYFEKAAENRRYQTPDAAYANAGVCARKIPDPVAADKYFRQALNKNASYSDAYYHLADLNLEQNKLILSQGYFDSYEKRITKGEESADFLWLGYKLHKALGDLNAAGQYSLQLQQRFPTSDQTKQLLDRS